MEGEGNNSEDDDVQILEEVEPEEESGGGGGRGGLDELPVAQICPAYLRANATSHEFPFSAIAELIDNANDPDVKASRVNIEFQQKNGYDCLMIKDDGNGMNRDKLFKMLSFGYSDKSDVAGHKAIGQYGNGFKSGSMRLGKDAIVLTKETHSKTMSVGFLSQTLLEALHADILFVPMVTWKAEPEKVDGVETYVLVDEKDRRSLELLLKHSLFTDRADLLQTLVNVPDFLSKDVSGTTIIIYNMGMKDKDGNFVEKDELQFITQGDGDILWRRAPEDAPQIRKSLRKYLQLLYKIPRMRIKVLGRNIPWRRDFTNLLKRQRTTTYKPRAEGTSDVDVLMGLTSRKLDPSDQSYGVLLYHKNRLIKAFMKLGYQKHSNEKGHGVVAVVQADYLEPIHNKQDFNKDDSFNNLCANVAKIMNDYWDWTENPDVALEPEDEIINWVKCDKCDKDRRLPESHQLENPDAEWYCYMHPRNLTCDDPEDELEEGKEREILDRSVGRNNRQKRKQRERDQQEKEIADRTAKRVKQEEGEKSNMRRLKTLKECNAALMKMHMNLAANFGELPDAVRVVVEDLHRERVGKTDAKLPFVQCLDCSLWRCLPPSSTESDGWVCRHGNFICGQKQSGAAQTEQNQDLEDVCPSLSERGKEGEESPPRLARHESDLEEHTPSTSKPRQSTDCPHDDEGLTESEEILGAELHRATDLMADLQRAIIGIPRIKEEKKDAEETEAELRRLREALVQKEARLANCRCSPVQARIKQEKSESEEELEGHVIRLVHKMIPHFRMGEGVSALEVVKGLLDTQSTFELITRNTPSPETYSE